MDDIRANSKRFLVHGHKLWVRDDGVKELAPLFRALLEKMNGLHFSKLVTCERAANGFTVRETQAGGTTYFPEADREVHVPDRRLDLSAIGEALDFFMDLARAQKASAPEIGEISIETTSSVISVLVLCELIECLKARKALAVGQVMFRVWSDGDQVHFCELWRELPNKPKRVVCHRMHFRVGNYEAQFFELFPTVATAASHRCELKGGMLKIRCEFDPSLTGWSLGSREHCPTATNLKHLVLDSLNYPQSVYFAYEALKNNTEWVELCVNRCDIPQEMILYALPMLTSLSVTGRTLVDPIFVSRLAKSNVDSLHLSGCTVTKEGGKALMQWAKSTVLKKLWLFEMESPNFSWLMSGLKIEMFHPGADVRLYPVAWAKVKPTKNFDKLVSDIGEQAKNHPEKNIFFGFNFPTLEEKAREDNVENVQIFELSQRMSLLTTRQS